MSFLRKKFNVEAVSVDPNKISDLVQQHKIVLEQLALAEQQQNVAAYCINLHARDVLEKRLQTTLKIRQQLKKQFAERKPTHKNLAALINDEVGKKELTERQTLGKQSSVVGLGDFFKSYLQSFPKVIPATAIESDAIQVLTLKK